MSRKALKVISNEPTKFIPKEYKDLDEKAKEMKDRPLIFWGKKLTRDQRYIFQEKMKLEYPENYDPKDKNSVNQIEVTGKGDAYRFIFDNCITKIENVLLDDNGKVEEIEVLKGADKDRYWNTEGDDVAILSAINHYVDSSSFDEAEEKN